MTQTYRTTDGTKWGSGKGSDLTATEVDVNFWDAIQRIVTLEALPSAAAGIDFFAVSGTQFYVHMTDATILGPYSLPVATFTDRGVWAVATSYAVLDTFTINGGVYVVLFAHVSDATTFSAGANDGAGHDYYKLMIQTPGSSLPTGGATGQVLEKSSSTNYATTWGYKLPTGGTARQYLIKQSGTTQDALWETPTAHDIHFVPVSGSSIAASNVADAIEEVATDAAARVYDASDITFTPASGSTLTSTHVDEALEDLAGRTIISTLAGLSDVNVTEGAPIDGYILSWNNSGAKWRAIAIAPARFPVLTSFLSGTGTISIDPTLGDVFYIEVSGNITLNATSSPIGSHIVIELISTNGSGFTVTMGSGFVTYGNIKMPKSSGLTYTIELAGDGTNLYEVARTAPPDARAQSTTGTITINPNFGNTYTVTPTGNITFNAGYVGVDQILKLIVTTSGTSSFNITFGTSFKSQGVLATGTVTAKTFVVTFVGDGTNFCEIGRTTAM